MDPWPDFVAATLTRHGVADLVSATAWGISETRFYHRTSLEGWAAPAPRVRVHPAARPSAQRSLLVACRSTRSLAAASHETAAWLHGLRSRPPQLLTILVGYDTALPVRDKVRVGRSRWLTADDVVEVDHVPTLRPAAALLTLAARQPEVLWGYLIDAVHRRLTTPDAVLDRLAGIGPVAGIGVLRAQCRRLAELRIESRFQDDVAAELERLGYQPSRSTVRIATPDGIGLTIDVALPAWQVAVEPEGDAFHRTREQRRNDRRRDAAAAGTDWVRIPVDWRDWHLDRPHVLAAIDAAIAAQQRRGIGQRIPSPRHLGG